MLEPTGRPPWTIASNPGMPVGSRGVGSSLQRTSQAATKCELRNAADPVPDPCLEASLRRARPGPRGAGVPKVPRARRDEFPESVQARLGPVHHLIEDGLSELLMVRREPMFHLDLDRGRADVPNPLEERVEVRDVEVDHFAKGSGLVLEIHLEPQLGGPQSILERTGVVGPPIDEAELREALKELRRGRGGNVKGPGDLAREVPVPVAQGPENRDAVLPGEEENGRSGSLLVHIGDTRNQAYTH